MAAHVQVVFAEVSAQPHRMLRGWWGRQAALTRVVSQYAAVCCDGNTELAALELRRQLRDHVVFERCAAVPLCKRLHTASCFAVCWRRLLAGCILIRNKESLT